MVMKISFQSIKAVKSARGFIGMLFRQIMLIR